jgi:hypothetical protein
MTQSSSSSSRSSVRERRLPGIQSIAASQSRCCVCSDPRGRKRIPKAALSQVWIEKSIVIPHENRTCATHLVDKRFTDAALELINPTKNGVLMCDDQLTAWILDLSANSQQKNSKRRRYDFENGQDVPFADYQHLVGVSKENFEILLSFIKPSVHSSNNRTPRNALAIFLMMIRHDFTQVLILFI